MPRTFAFALSGFLPVACGSAHQARVPPGRETVAASPSATARAPAAPPAAAGTLEPVVPAPTLERFDPPPSGSALVEIAFPTPEQVIPSSKSAAYTVRLKVEGWDLDKNAVQLVLDGHVSRPVREIRAPLAALVPEGHSLAEGEHVLVAFAVDEQGLVARGAGPSTRGPFAAVHFYVGVRATAKLAATDPMVVLNSPRGTFNGEARAGGAILDAFVLAASVSPPPMVSVTLRGPDGRAERTMRLPADAPYRIHGLSSGDYDVELTLVDAVGTPFPSPLAESARTIVVNRDSSGGT